MKRMTELEETITTREAELEAAQDGARFWQAAADHARTHRVAYHELARQADRMRRRTEQLYRELAELKGESWSENDDEAEANADEARKEFYHG